MLQVSQLMELCRSERPTPGRESALRFGSVDHLTVPVVVWNICQHCNMTCPHCYAAASIRPSPGDLDTTQGRDLLRQLAEAGTRVIVFSGGEPLLREDLFELIVYARELGLSPHLSTNGTLIDDACAERLAKFGVVYVGISIDGPQAFNDAHRGLERGYELAIRGLRAARRAGIKTGLRMTLMRSNMAFLDEMLEVAKAEADRFYVSHLLYSGRGAALASDDLTPSETHAVLLRLFETAEGLLEEGHGLQLVTGSNDSDGVLLLRWLRERYGERAERVHELLSRRGGNSAGEKILCVDPRGRVYPDPFWRTTSLGDLKRQTFAEILRHPLREQLRTREERLEGRCGTCPDQRLCRGSHRERALAVHGSIWAEDPACVAHPESRPVALSLSQEQS